MQVSKVQSPSFKAIHAQTSKMTRAQQELTARLTDAISYSDSYAKAKSLGIDICIFPKGKKNIKARFLDRISESYVKNKNKTAVTFSSTLDENKDTAMTSIAAENNRLYKTADKFISKLDEVLSGKFGFEEADEEKIYAGDTDMNKLFNELKSYEIDEYNASSSRKSL